MAAVTTLQIGSLMLLQYNPAERELVARAAYGTLVYVNVCDLNLQYVDCSLSLSLALCTLRPLSAAFPLL